MTEASPVNLELAILLPLGVIANQLMRVEADLRSLNMNALVYAKERANGDLAAQISTRLERINEALDLIRGLMSDFEGDIQPRAARRERTSSTDHASLKPPPDRDD